MEIDSGYIKDITSLIKIEQYLSEKRSGLRTAYENSVEHEECEIILGLQSKTIAQQIEIQDFITAGIDHIIKQIHEQ